MHYEIKNTINFSYILKCISFKDASHLEVTNKFRFTQL